MNARILVVDDEPEILALIHDALSSQGYTVDTARSGEEAQGKVRLLPDLILLDVMMPGQNGFAVCQAIRTSVSCPIVFLTARDAEEDRVRGLAVGGDDYLIKPFGIAELRARVHAHLRREERARDTSTTGRVHFGPLQLDVAAHAVYVRGEPVPLTPREFEILSLCALHPGQVFSKEKIYDTIWGYDALGDASTVTEHIKKIRSKLAIMDPERTYIATIWGVGYRWNVAKER